MTINQIRKEIINSVKEIATLEGLVLKDKDSQCCSFIKETPFGFNKVQVCFEKYPPIYFASICKIIRINEIEDIFNLFRDINKDYISGTFTLVANMVDYGYNDTRIKIENEIELEEAILAIRNFLEVDSRDFFEKFNTIDAIDKEFNRDNRSKNLYLSDASGRTFVGLISAHLNNNPNFSFWEKYYSDFMENKNEHLRKQFSELKTYLKTTNAQQAVYSSRR